MFRTFPTAQLSGIMETAPGSILIIGAGVFGLSTAWDLTKRPFFANTAITVVDQADGGAFPPADCASVDSSRIIRADYADPHYAALGAEAQKEWRKQGDDELGGQGRYSESGFVLTAYENARVTAGKKSGMEYTKESWKNVESIAKAAGASADKVRPLESREALAEYLGTKGSHPGDWGYLNGLSGWADAGRGMSWLFKQVEATGRVKFVDAEVEQLTTAGKKVTGAKLANGSVLQGDVVFVAAGAWTGKLIDMRGRTEATGHVLGYMDISEEELAVLSKQPVVLNLSSGLFVIPPQGRILKIARHSYGYINPETITHALPTSPSEQRQPFLASQPKTGRSGAPKHLPAEADRDLRRALKDLVPLQGLEERPWREARICWYSDSRDGEFLVDWHPGWESLFVATGDSGHGYKFLPVLGEKVVDCMTGKGGELAKKWRWKEMEDDDVGRETNGVYKGLSTEDGSRGGAPGMILKEELKRA